MSIPAILLNIVLFILYGVIFAVLSMIPAVQKFAWASRGKRILVIALNAILVVVVSFILMTNRNVNNDLEYAQNPQVGLAAAANANRAALVRELWLREVLPAYVPGAPACFSANAPWSAVQDATTPGEQPLFPPPQNLCELADQIGVIAQQDYAIYWGFYLLAGVVCAVAAWFFTRPKPDKPAEEEPEPTSPVS